MNRLSIIIKIAGHTIIDELRQKSFIAIFIVCGLFVMLVRSCYGGGYTVNGQALDQATIAWQVSKTVFHIIGGGVYLIAALLAMRLLRRDRDEGTISAIMSRPILREEYLAGRIAGLWALSSAWMFTLHFIIFGISWYSTHAIIPGYLTSSLICTLNILFAVSATMLLSMRMPDFVSFLIVSAIGLFSTIGGGIYAVTQNQNVQQMMSQTNVQQALSGRLDFWNMVYLVWPKLSEVQGFAGSLIGNEPFVFAGFVHPLINMAMYTAIVSAGLVFAFRKKDLI